MAGLDLLFRPVIEAFPESAQQSSDPEWQALATIIQNYRDELVRTGGAGVSSIEMFDDFFKCEKIPVDFLLIVAESFDARVTPGLTEREIRQRICSAMAEHRLHATIGQLIDFIFEITGFTPEVLWTVASPPGWDETDQFVSPAYEVDYGGGIKWDETDAYSWAFLWQVRRKGLFVDIKNLGAYTVDQLNAIYALVAELKPADYAVNVGYFTPSPVILKTIYSTDLTQTAWLSIPDPGIDG